MALYKANALKRRLAAGQPALGFWVTANSLAVTEQAAGAGWDWLLLDTEHVVHDLGAVERHLLAARHGGDAEFVVRVPTTDPVVVKQLMDAGVRSFMFPFVQTVEEARLAVAATRYPPKGIRGFAGGTRAASWGRNPDYLSTYENDVCVIIQIESPQAVANIPSYGEIEGLDAMLIGANDLAANMGHLGDIKHAEVVAKFDEAGEAIMRTGKAAGFQSFDGPYARTLVERGFTLAAVAHDLTLLARGTAGTLSDFGR
ncbi:MAG TPA: aldolase/citrate lyase family protein [Devosia sp.]|nr:aldolase/citrate lyase family protein [Devosia sp.]